MPERDVEPLFDSVREMQIAISALQLELPRAVWEDVRERWDRLHVEIAERWGDA